MVKCKEFIGEPASGHISSQPFHLQIHSNALLVSDFHAHLATTEIIGFLGGIYSLLIKINPLGSWDAEKKSTFPVDLRLNS